jgi:plastocyanin
MIKMKSFYALVVLTAVFLTACEINTGSRAENSVYVHLFNIENKKIVKEEVIRIDMIAGNHFFEPAEFTVQPGAVVEIHLKNEGRAKHDLVFEYDKNIASKRLFRGETETIRFTTPDVEGTYVYYCSIGIHRKLGMEGVMHVKR